MEKSDEIVQVNEIVNNNINQIYADMSTNKSPRQTCQDIKECPQPVRFQTLIHLKVDQSRIADDRGSYAREASASSRCVPYVWNHR